MSKRRLYEIQRDSRTLVEYLEREEARVRERREKIQGQLISLGLPAVPTKPNELDPNVQRLVSSIAGAMVGLEMLLERRDIPKSTRTQLNTVVREVLKRIEEFRREMRGEESTEDTADESESV